MQRRQLKRAPPLPAPSSHRVDRAKAPRIDAELALAVQSAPPAMSGWQQQQGGWQQQQGAGQRAPGYGQQAQVVWAAGGAHCGWGGALGPFAGAGRRASCT